MLLLLLSYFSRVQLHRWQPTRLPHPWDIPGKNTGVGCCLLLQCMKVKSESEDAQSCPTLSDPMDCSPSGSCIHGILQARVLEWVAISFSNYPSWSTENSPSRSSPLFESLIAHIFSGGLLAHMVKKLSAMQETWVLSLDWEGLLEIEMATHSSILAWEIPWTEKPGKLQSRGLQRVRHD